MEKSENSRLKKVLLIAYIIFSVAVFAVVLIITPTREIFIKVTNDHPYIMGFVKFALLATAGELLAARLGTGEWVLPKYITVRFIIWGIIGVWITYMMKMFGAGAAALIASGLIPGEGTSAYTFIKALTISVTMNTGFGPTFMALHKCSDTYLALKAEGRKNIRLKDVINSVDWTRFVSFTLFKTIPLFWIPMHTITFMLPEAYTVMVAAFLSMALGIILNFRKGAKKSAKKAA